MLQNISFRARLFICFLIVSIAACMLPAIYARYTIRAEAIEDTKKDILRELFLIRQLFLEKKSFSGREQLQQWLISVSDSDEVRLSYISNSGALLADSRLAFSSLGNEDLGIRPEIIQAKDNDFGLDIRPGFFSGTSSPQTEFIYAATSINELTGIEPGFIRLAVSLSKVEKRLTKLATGFIMMSIAVLGLAILISIILVRGLTSSVNSMINVARDIGYGKYSRRVHIYPGKEFCSLASSINHMASAIESHISTITKHTRELKAILDGMKEGVMVLNEQGLIAKINPALKTILGKETDFTGIYPLEAIPSPELQEACNKALAGTEQEPFLLEIELESQHFYTVTIVGLKPQESDMGAVLVFHDISELKRLEKIRRDFVANVSHELRTPLTTIKGYSETLVNTPEISAKRTKSFLEVILKNADHMSKMIEDLLILSRLEGDRKQFNLSKINPVRALNEARRACLALAKDKKIILKNNITHSDETVLADHDRLVQVFRNLLENAIKYSPCESVVELIASEQEKEIIFTISDFGPGVPDQDKQRIFERFYRVEKHRTKKGRISSGLGLAISKHIADRLQGKIWVEDRNNSHKTGSRFYFSLPLVQK